MNHGAVVKQHLTGKVTHVIALQMTDSKMVQIKSQPVLVPQFIHDSIKSGLTQPVDQYRLFSPILDPNQKSIDSYLERNTPKNDHLIVSDNSAKEEEPVRIYDKEELDLDDENTRRRLCTAPGFLESYFSSSRLHHLSTWKTSLIQFVKEKMKDLNKKPSSNLKDRTIMHVDMDCFFASVALRKRPDLVNSPVVVAHNTSDVGDTSSTSEIASCNYVARSKGISNGSYLGKAWALAPDLVVLPYDFDAIVECSKALYKVLIKYSDFIQAVSCDEALIDVTGILSKDYGNAEQIADLIRKSIFQATDGCGASIGIGYNPLTARLATHKAKPDGVYHLSEMEIDQYMYDLPISKLPGVGWQTMRKFEALDLVTCGQLQEFSLIDLQKEFGAKNGETLYQFCRGLDDRILENKARETVGAEVNWAVRFRNDQEVHTFLNDLAREVFTRMSESKIISNSMTLKCKKRNYKGEPTKYLGCGHCLDYAKSYISKSTYSNAEMIFKDAYRLLVELQIPYSDIRGLGIHLKRKSTQLENGQTTLSFTAMNNQNTKFYSPVKVVKKTEVKAKSSQEVAKLFESKYGVHPNDIDVSVLAALPASVLAELKESGLKNIHSLPSNSVDQDKELSENDLFPTISQIDPDVANAIPPELLKQHKIQVKAQKRQQRTTLPCVNEVKKVKVQPNNIPQLSGETDASKIIDYIKEWLSESHRAQEVPSKVDIDLVTIYLIQLIDDFQMEHAHRLLNYILSTLGVYDPKGKKCSSLWADAALYIRECVENHISKLYNNSKFNL